jgi:hypothetical protein
MMAVTGCVSLTENQLNYRAEVSLEREPKRREGTHVKADKDLETQTLRSVIRQRQLRIRIIVFPDVQRESINAIRAR